VPSTEPTLSITSQWRERLTTLENDYSTVHFEEAAIARSLITYFDVRLNNEDVSSSSSDANGCFRWDQFLSSLSARQVGYTTAYVSVMAFDTLGAQLGDVPNITCKAASVAQLISDALVSNYQLLNTEVSVSCLAVEDDTSVSSVQTIWRVAQCGSSPYIEVSTNASSTAFLRLSPCNDTCDQSITTDTTTSSTFTGAVGVIRSVAIQFTAQYPTPTIMSLSVQAVSKSTVQTVVQLDEPGLVYCAAYDTATYVVPSSVEAVILSSVSAWSVVVNGKNISSVNITNLAASTEYTVLCAVSSVQSITSSLQTVLTKYNRTVTTLCCRQVLVSVLANSLALTSSSTAIVRNAIKVSVSSLPTGSKQALSVSVYLRKSGVSYLASLSPNALTYTSASTLSSSMLTLLSLSTAGTYNVTVSLSGTAKSLYETVFSGSGSSTISVIDTSTATNIVVAPPTMTSATFSSDGVSISVVFDRSTSLGQELGTNSQFSCSKMFRFSEVTAASLASCQFGANGSAVTIKPASSSTITVGSNITLLGATLKAACFVNYNCSRWKYASTSVLSVVGPAVATVPTVLVAAPSIIGSCTNYVIDVSGSVGSGYRGWKSITYQVVGSALNASDLQAYLTSLSGSSSTASLLRVSVPYAYFNALSVYSITATLCNFLGVCGQSQVSLSVSALSAPVVSVVGPNVISQYSSQVTTLKALAYTTSCGSTASTSANLAYVWSLVARSTTSGQISSANTPKSTTGSLLTIGAYALTPLNTYSVSISVTSLVTKQTSTSSVTIAVLQGLLHAVISGGSTRSVRVLNGAAVDGSGSYDSDQAGYGSVGVSYLWSGYQLTPTYQTSCNILLSYGSSSTATVYGLVNATNSTCVVSLIVGLDTRVASSSISVNFLGELSPKVSISSTSPSSLTHISIASKVSVLASIELGTSPVLCVWSFDDSVTTVSSSLSLSSIALTSTKTVVAASSSSSSSASVPLNLVISASQLPSGAQLTLALTCSVVNATSKSLTSVNTILITTNAPPSPGSFTVSPTSGVSLVTVFTYGASAWSDTDGDYPLNYQYGFASPTDGTFVVVSGRSLTVRATSALPPGVAGSNYGVSTRLNVFDSLSAITSTTLAVRVNNSLFTSSSSGSSSASQKLNISFIGSVVSSGLSSAGLDTDSLKQVISTTAVAMNSVSCGGAPANCTALGRYHCSSVVNTCGSCLPNFVGASGASNQACVNVKDLAVSASSGSCESSADCPNAWYTCDVMTKTCYSPAKTCTNNCTDSSQGVCVYEDSVSGVSRDSCSQDDISCVAVCECLTGYSGTSCDVTSSELSSRQSIRVQLIDSMSTVVDAESSSESATVAAWSSGLQALTAAPSEVSEDALSTAIDLSGYILEVNVAEGFSFDTVSSTLLSTVDNLFDAMSTSTVSSSRRLISTSTRRSATDSLKEVLDTASTAAISHLVAGEDADEYIEGNFRMSVQVFSSRVSSQLLSTPLSESESDCNETESAELSLSFSDAGSQSSDSTASFSASILSLKSVLFSSYDPSTQSTTSGDTSTFVTLGDYLANPLRVAVEADSCTNSSIDAAKNITFKFKNSVSMNSSNMWILPNLSYTTHCSVEGSASGGFAKSVFNYSCPYGANISHFCDGVQAYTQTSVCANARVEPQCAVTTASGDINCTVSEFTDDYTVCTCNLCDLATNSTISSRRNMMRRQLSSMSTGKFSAEVQGLTAYISTDFTEASLELDSFSLKTVENADVVIITFVVLWSVMFACVGAIEVSGVMDKFSDYTDKLSLHTGYAGKRTTMFFPNKLQLAASAAANPNGVKGAEGSAEDTLSSTASLQQAKKFMKAYVFTFFPNVFSEKPEMMKFWHEIVHRHRYFSIFVREKGFKKFVGTLEILTLLTAHMFLVAVLYDAEWPSDNGFCGEQTASGEAVCLQRRSVFDKHRSMCAWSVSSNNGGECVWVQPTFDPSMQIFLTMIVIAFSGPINAIVSVLIKVLILSPTQTEVSRRTEIIRTRRASALGSLPSQQNTVNSLVPSMSAGSLGRVAPAGQADAEAERSAVTRSRASTLLSGHVSRVVDLDESLMAYCLDDHKMRRHLTTMFSTTAAAGGSHSVTTSVPHGDRAPEEAGEHVDQLFMFSNVMKLLTDLRKERNALTGREKMRFNDQWEEFLSQGSSYEDPSSEECILRLTNELRRVNSEAQSVVRKLRSIHSSTGESTNAMIGVQILELFVLDLMGRQSRQAQLFANQRSAVKMKFATSVWVKALSVCLVLGLDVYFILMCVVYGDLKGRRWQINWMISCFVYVIVDIFIKHVNIVFMVYYYIPELIKTHTDVMKLRLTKAIDNFVKHSFSNKSARMDTSSTVSSHAFSVTDYLFVSNIVARAFPQLLESSIVLSYRSHTISEYQAMQLRNRQTNGFNRVLMQLFPGFANARSTPSTSWQWNTVTSVLSMTFVNLLITLGCQNVLLQKIVVQTVDPLIMGAIAFLGSVIVRSSMLGVPIVVAGVIVVLSVFGYYSYRRRTKLSMHSSTAGAAVDGPKLAGRNARKVNPDNSGSSEDSPDNSEDRSNESSIEMGTPASHHSVDSYDDAFHLNDSSDGDDDADSSEAIHHPLVHDDVDGVYEDEETVLRKVRSFLRSHADDSASKATNNNVKQSVARHQLRGAIREDSSDGDGKEDYSDDEEGGNCVEDRPAVTVHSICPHRPLDPMPSHGSVSPSLRDSLAHRMAAFRPFKQISPLLPITVNDVTGTVSDKPAETASDDTDLNIEIGEEDDLDQITANIRKFIDDDSSNASPDEARPDLAAQSAAVVRVPPDSPFIEFDDDDESRDSGGRSKYRDSVVVVERMLANQQQYRQHQSISHESAFENSIPTVPGATVAAVLRGPALLISDDDDFDD
jgi:hypothetical protein